MFRGTIRSVMERSGNFREGSSLFAEVSASLWERRGTVAGSSRRFGECPAMFSECARTLCRFSQIRLGKGEFFWAYPFAITEVGGRARRGGWVAGCRRIGLYTLDPRQLYGEFCLFFERLTRRCHKDILGMASSSIVSVARSNSLDCILLFSEE